MKKQFIHILLPLLFISCEIDNYDAPNGGLFGRIIDSETGESVPQAVPSDFGLRLRFYEADREHSLEQHFYAQTDGSFRNSRIFNCPIRLVLEQRNFLPVDTLNISINGQTQCDISVVPYLRFRIEDVATDERMITIRFSVSRSDNASFKHCKIMGCNLLWNASPQIDNQSVNYAGKVLYTDAPADTPDQQLLADAYSMELDLSKAGNRTKLEQLAHLIRANDNRIYLRLCASTKETVGNDSAYYYNYSEIIPVQIHIE
jgi:hypothetical protein